MLNNERWGIPKNISWSPKAMSNEPVANYMNMTIVAALIKKSG
jgi:hypothetical protein